MSVKKGTVINRRGFLKGVAATGGAVAAATVVSETANSGAPVVSNVDRETQDTADGYHVTPHILDYYKKARF